jgi:hypothetical protein
MVKPNSQEILPPKFPNTSKMEVVFAILFGEKNATFRDVAPFYWGKFVIIWGNPFDFLEVTLIRPI